MQKVHKKKITTKAYMHVMVDIFTRDRPKFVFVFGTENDIFSVFGHFRFRPKIYFRFRFRSTFIVVSAVTYLHEERMLTAVRNSYMQLA